MLKRTALISGMSLFLLSGIFAANFSSPETNGPIVSPTVSPTVSPSTSPTGSPSPTEPLPSPSASPSPKF